MSIIVDNLKKNYKAIVVVALVLFMLPAISLLIEIIYNYGQVAGTFIRSVVEKGTCI